MDNAALREAARLLIDQHEAEGAAGRVLDRLRELAAAGGACWGCADCSRLLAVLNNRRRGAVAGQSCRTP